MREGNLVPGSLASQENAHCATESIGVGQAQTAFGAVNFQARNFCCPHVERGYDGSDWPAGKFEESGDMCWNVNVDSGAFPGLAGNCALCEGRACRTAHTAHWAK